MYMTNLQRLFPQLHGPEHVFHLDGRARDACCDANPLLRDLAVAKLQGTVQ